MTGSAALQKPAPDRANVGHTGTPYRVRSYRTTRHRTTGRGLRWPGAAAAMKALRSAAARMTQSVSLSGTSGMISDLQTTAGSVQLGLGMDVV